MYPWKMPQAFDSNMDIMDRMHPLKVVNSLTRSKVRFVPKDAKRVLWYQCGPTVYAASHLGHARTYVQLDIIRRITQDYLGYNVVLCQNITDIDDKIIIRSSEQKVGFRELAAANEEDFFDDMNKLGVRLPDLVTRVSEYVPEIIDFIQDLCNKGFAYPSNGSVYFNTRAFEKGGHKYGKLVPEQIGNSELLAEGEGALTAGDEKKNATDFVLWKKTKEHADDGVVEPAWDSPWGSGRPGWHIECSVMSKSALETFGTNVVDVHAGGVDLKFPHHENEIAQSEGRCDCDQWVNYWLHTGHLNIHGLKMSKSLKNFVTIKEALQTHTSRQLRFLFLLHRYNVPMDYGDGTMNQAVSIEKIFSEFFLNIKAVLRRLGLSGPQHVGDKERSMLLALEDAKEKVHSSLLDDFDTPSSISALLELVRHTNRYVEESTASSSVLMSVGRYITSILRVFGLIPEGTDVGFPLESGGGVENKEDLLSPYLDALTKFRENVRVAAIGGDSKAVLKAADELRDLILPELGVRMEDKGSGADVVSVWKLEDPEVMRMERQRKEAEKAAKEQEKEANRRRLKEKEERNKIPPSEMFRKQTDLYSVFDESTGIPTHDAKGEPLSKKMVKRLEKEYDKQKEAHAKYLASVKA